MHRFVHDECIMPSHLVFISQHHAAHHILMNTIQNKTVPPIHPMTLDDILFDFSKALDVVTHTILTQNLVSEAFSWNGLYPT